MSMTSASSAGFDSFLVPTTNIARSSSGLIAPPPHRPSPASSAASLLPTNGELAHKSYDEHAVGIDEIERRLQTNREMGLTSQAVAQLQSTSSQLNLLPTDAETGHGSIHELVGVLRDASWIHTRAENLVPGDVITLKEGQCVPADVRIIESHDLWVDQHVLLGNNKRDAEPRIATHHSVFDDAPEHANVPYMEATNLAFYGTTITHGHGKAIVIRTGKDTVLGTISGALLQKRLDDGCTHHGDMALTETMKQQFDVFSKDDLLPSAMTRISALVVEHSDVIKRTVVAASFGVNPTVIIELEDLVLANETSSEDLEREIALQMMNYCSVHEDAALFTKALAACRHRVESGTSTSFASGGSTDVSSTRIGPQSRVPSLPASSPIAAPVVIDPLRDQQAILRFCAQFGGMQSPRQVNAAYRKNLRYSTLLHTQVSGCEVYVHFDQECGAHVVLLQGPAREILSRCGHVRRDGTATMAPLETLDLQKIQDMVMDLEARNQTVVSFAELYLDPERYPVGVKFDIEQFNFPTSNMCYLGSLGLIEKLQPEVVVMGSFARAADVRILITSNDVQYPDDHAPLLVDDDESIHEEDEDDIDGEESGGSRVRCVCKVPVRLREASTGEVFDVDACVFRSNVLSISNTLSQWRQILTQHAIVVFDGCSPAQIDLLVETLQELGECVGLVASGSANALAIANADVGFAIPAPADSSIDLSEDAAYVVLASTMCPRSDAIRLIEATKKLKTRAASIDNASYSHRAPLPTGTTAKAKSVITNLLRESIAAGKLLGLTDADLQTCFETVLTDSQQQTTGATGALLSPSIYPAATQPASPTRVMSPPPLSPSKFPPSAFRSTGILLNPRSTTENDDAAHAAVSSI
uniref:P-type ATPase A domain-containing protein n=1 Tax=Globisporangium ultimum (strain ATCC 200006 / CBS 805.95 / DAOM BR144) TaxID=431595 RepID=K3WRL3_GLOUD